MTTKRLARLCYRLNRKRDFGCYKKDRGQKYLEIRYLKQPCKHSGREPTISLVLPVNIMGNTS